MKKYSTPKTAAFESIQGGVLCESNGGLGQQENPIIESGQGTNAAPTRLF